MINSLRSCCVLSLAIVFCLISCTNDSAPGQDAGADRGPSSVSVELDEKGGTINLPAGGTLEILEGALAEKTTITVQTVAAPQGTRYTALGPFYRFSPSPLVFGGRVIIRLPYKTPAGFDSASNALVVAWTQTDGTWSNLVTTADAAPGMLVAGVEHFSEGGPASAPAGDCQGCDGCCDSVGTCHRLADTSSSGGTGWGHCGTGGAKCVQCPSTEDCFDGKCGDCAKNCNGCCHFFSCRLSDRQSAELCGAAGEKCAACSAGQTCKGGMCTKDCGPGNCAGCCDPVIGCDPAGDSPMFCGTGGAQCQSCGQGQDCIEGKCQTCAEHCTGCCSSAGDCVTEAKQTEKQCGTKGATCAACPAGQVCKGGKCIRKCGPDNCGGCCDANGDCVPVAIQDGTRCGQNGATCTSCGAGQTCSGGTCSTLCGPATCGGCCDGAGTCVAGASASACGTNGALCKVCSGGEDCFSGVCKACAQNCAGCCSATGSCVPLSTQSAAQCGVSGATCKACATGQTCTGGTCSTPCGPATCGGCCDGSGNCLAGASLGACGTNGALCKICSQGDDCFSGACKACAQNCAGCCDSSGSCLPLSMQNPAQCGVSGAACGPCSSGQTCQSGVCTSKQCACGETGVTLTAVDNPAYSRGPCNWPDKEECSGWHSACELTSNPKFDDGHTCCLYGCCITIHCP